jgi:putative two-component system response regulator
MLTVELDAMLGRRTADSRLRCGGRILFVGDDVGMQQLVEWVLVKAGFGPLTTTSDARRAIARFRDAAPDIVLLDLPALRIDVDVVIQQLSERFAHSEFLPIVVLVEDANPEHRQHLLGQGACDIIDRSTGLSDLPLRLQNVLRVRDLANVLEQRVTARTMLLHNTELELASRLAATAELCDYGDASHVQRVGRTSALLAAQLDIAPEQVQLIRHAAPLHDIGKIAIPDAILLKSEPLTLEEWDVLKTHTTVGARLLAGSISPILQLAEEIALYHHEHWDGTGYTGWSGEDIPLVARIVAVADVFDALTHDRPYKSAWPTAEALDWMRTMRGQRFDARVLDALVDVLQVTDLTDLGTETIALVGPRSNVPAPTRSTGCAPPHPDGLAASG